MVKKVSPKKHIAMWTCARSRSTLMTRAFQQLDGCVVFDEPLYPPYLATQEVDHPHRSEIIEHYETDYQKVILKITGDLPQGASFSFQKHTANNLPKNLDLDWLLNFENFFLIRHPREIIASRQNVYHYPKDFTLEEIGLEDLYNLFRRLQKWTGKDPLVVDSTDLIKNPRKVLQALCTHLGRDYSDRMLTWESGIRETDPLWAKSWYTTIVNSSGFIPFTQQEITLPKYLSSITEKCLPFYDKLYEYRIVL
ncbi:hypothetical protein [Roseofilum capinflatum]|uniref:Sulfotransferase family protein n=1 Tax=Roseofilum capinflatum BLCC-M114 TaxID=3022440 RepID=A0ABT7B7C7_9CYAN|nr:hypothetical protein [Roseofilum capinflatum]MDJ1174456.1 hypothetical protein [Roseofilum capinflatum BLCC-M114]